MNDSEFEQKVRGLRLTEGDKQGILALGVAPPRFPWFRAILFLILASQYIWIGWEAMVFTYGEAPLHTAEPVSATSAHATARLVGLFFTGCLFIAAAILSTMDWWIARGNASIVRKLVAVIPEGEQSGVLGTSSDRALPTSRDGHG